MAHLALSAARPDGVTVARVIAPDRRITALSEYNPDGRPQRLADDLAKLARTAHGPVVLDCRGVELIDSAGVGVVLSLWKGLRISHHPLALCGAKAIRQVFDVARLTRLFPVCPDLDAAVKGVLPPGADPSPPPPRSEKTWFADPDPVSRLESLPPGTSARKCRLFAVACGRRLGHLLGNPTCRKAMETAEHHADGGATDEELAQAHEAAAVALAEADDRGRLTAPMACAAAAAEPDAARAAWLAAAWAGEVDGPDPQQAIVSDVFGNPFRPAPADLNWLTERVRRLAWTIDNDGDFDLMPDLAIALKAAGCTDVALLAHCREPSGHARGCWAVDALLGK